MTNSAKTYKINSGGRERRPPHKTPTAQGKNKMKEKNFNYTKNATKMSEYQIGQVDVLNQLETIIQRWIVKTEQKTLKEFFNFFDNDHGTMIIKERINTYKKVLADIKTIKENLCK